MLRQFANNRMIQIWDSMLELCNLSWQILVIFRECFYILGIDVIYDEFFKYLYHFKKSSKVIFIPK